MSTDPNTHSNDLDIRIGNDELVIRNRYETLSITNDFLIGVMFVVGSILFLWSSTTTVGTVFFIIGSAQLLIRPSLRLSRRFHLRRFGPGRDRLDQTRDY
ncbi:hypothetical protein FHX49_001497 [Microbacterium endophyticum]|uniref:YrhK domain-containing protein n=1 Tax=Microbacterium endophyticum TaxID=1526412 RepID=A0A7W4V322_9MICO|nr:YrhK family protein [Microbacterium endophyticum]MBB2975930.1 hypothetical protein [Microbacterium endophyticum]NIK37701.1 hypothetical protein [Microbacterium endophyticum]